MKRIITSVVILLLAEVLAHRPGAIHAANGSHAPIVITSDSDFGTCGCVAGGSGTTTDPYVIGPLAINSTEGSSPAVSIDGTLLTKSFNLKNLTIAGNGSNASTGIVLNHINPSGQNSILAEVTGAQTSIQSNGIGILVENSSFVILDGGGANPNGAGIGTGAVGTINKNFIGAIDIENSNHITVTGWQFSSNGQNNMPDYVSFDPDPSLLLLLSNPSQLHWGVGAVRLFETSDSIIDHNAANNCTTASFVVFHSRRNTISNNTADYPFTNNVLITDGSLSNTVSNNVFSTADFVGIMVADPLPGTWTLNKYGPTHDNTIKGNIDHSDGPTGKETHSGTAPAFLGGIVILNGTYDNMITTNQVFSSTGPDLAWAQAVPDPNSPIGVLSYPPLVNCNVTASEGGGGTNNHNGNVWSGNTVRTIDSCIGQ